MLRTSQLASQILQEKEDLRKPAREMALHVCSGHFAKIDAFWASLLKRGGIVNPDVVLTHARYSSGSNEHQLVFVGDEKSVLEAINGIRIERQPVPETVAVKMLALRLVKVIDGIEAHNKHEREREIQAAAQCAQVPKPAWAQPYTPEILPQLELSDLPDCLRFSTPSLPPGTIPTSAWQYRGNGKAIFELRKIWCRPEFTQRVVELAWQQAAVRQVMGS